MRAGLCSSFIATVSIFGLAAAAFAAEGTKDPYRVSVIVAKTGVLASVLGPAGTGFEAKIDAVNKAGGAGGRPIKIDILDEQSTPAVAAGLFQRVLADPPLAMVFFGQSTSQTQSRQLLENAGIPILTVTADDSFLYPKPVKTMFMVSPSAIQQAEGLVAVARQKLGDLKDKKIATASVQTTFSDAIVKNLEALGQKHGFKVVTSERFPAGIPSFASQGAKIARLQPDSVFVLAGNADGPLVIKAISDAGVTAKPIIGYISVSSNEVFKKADLANYFAFRAANVASDIPSIATKVTGPMAADMSNTWWGMGWVVADVLAQAVNRCGDSCTGQKLLNTIETSGPIKDSEGVMFGPVSFSIDNHAGVSMVQAYKWQGSNVVADGSPVAMGASAK